MLGPILLFIGGIILGLVNVALAASHGPKLYNIILHVLAILAYPVSIIWGIVFLLNHFGLL